MGALGGVLGTLLLLALMGLAILIHKHYGQRLKCRSGKALVRPWGVGQEGVQGGGGEAAGWGPGSSRYAVEQR